jgi:hypothetical protein
MANRFRDGHRKALILALLVSISLFPAVTFLAGCASAPKFDNSARLMRRADFPAAAAAAPEWCRAALKKINALEYELERR